MITRLTDEDQLNIPESVIANLPDTELFEVTCDDGRISLAPISEDTIIERADKVRRKVEERGITEQDIADAVKWARKNKGKIEAPETFMTLRKVQLEQDEDGRWSVWMDSLPGCAAWGYTRDEALAAIKDAGAAYIEDMVEAGELTIREGRLVIEKRR